MAENPNTELLTLGKGIVSVAKWSGGSPGAYRDVGEAPEFNVEISVEDLPYNSGRSGTRKKIKEAVLETGYRINFSLSEIGLNNLELFMMGTREGNKVHALTSAGTKQEYAIKFVSDNPEGPNGTWEFWKAKIKPNGASSLIGEGWMNLPHVAEGLADVANHASSPFFDIEYSTTTTTTAPTTTTTTA